MKAINRVRASRSLGCFLAGVSLLLPTSAGAQDSNEAELIMSGAAVYGKMCGRCHNPRSPIERSDREWVTIIAHMRVRGNLTGGQVRQILAFLQATNTDPGQPTPIASSADVVEGAGTPGAVNGELEAPIRLDLAERGGQVLREKACLGCHVLGGEGGNVGPKLDGVIDRRDLGYLRRKLRDPTFDNSTSMMPNLALSQEEVEAILAHLAKKRE